MASSSRTDSWPRSGRVSVNENAATDQNQNRKLHHKSSAGDGKELESLRNEVFKLKKEKQEWSQLQQDYVVSNIYF